MSAFILGAALGALVASVVILFVVGVFFPELPIRR